MQSEVFISGEVQSEQCEDFVSKVNVGGRNCSETDCLAELVSVSKVDCLSAPAPDISLVTKGCNIFT